MAIRITRVYTRRGDQGDTDLVGGPRVPKDSPAHRRLRHGRRAQRRDRRGARRQRHGCQKAGAGAQLDGILRACRTSCSTWAASSPHRRRNTAKACSGRRREVQTLEHLMDRCQKDLQPLKSFVLPGGGTVSAFLHVARTVCRRAERDVLRLMRREDVGEWPLAYLNRLSDLLFVLSRWIGHHRKEREFLWERPLEREAELRARRGGAPRRTKRR
jgi:cob(I)alamin adenosyltransferase